MNWPPHIERWRQYAKWEGKDIPTDLILSIIAHESSGQPGIKSNANTVSAQLPTDTGQTTVVNRAMGLMQVIPPHITSWNEKKHPLITFEDMTGNDERAVRLQIRIGSSIFANCVYKLYQFDSNEFPGDSPGKATSEQLKLALVAYAIGPGRRGGTKGLIPKLEQLQAQKLPLTLQSLQTSFPYWGYSHRKKRWINKPLQAAFRMWSNYKTHSGKTPSSASGYVDPPEIKKRKNIFDGWLFPIIIIGSAIFLSKKNIF